MKKVLILVVSASLMLQSCATVFTGTSQKITFKAPVEGEVYQNLSPIGKTNQEIRVKRKDLEKLYTIKAPGYQDKQMELPVTTNAVYYLNLPLIIVGVGLIGAFLDVAKQAHKKTDKEINVTLEKR